MKAVAKISMLEIFFMFVILINGSYSIILPHTMMKEAGADAILCFLIGSIVGIAIVYLITSIGMANREKTIVEIAPTYFGKFIGKIIGFIFCCFFTFLASYCLRVFMEMILAEILPNTPAFILLSSALIVLIVLVCNGL